MAVTNTLAAPSGKAWVGVTLQLPLAGTTTSSTSPVGKVTVIVSPGVTPVPLMTGVFAAYADDSGLLFPGAPFILAAALMAGAVTVLTITLARHGQAQASA